MPYTYTPGDWITPIDKRGLSIFDKHTLPLYQGNALIMPGEPGTEYEELIDAGFPSENIHCVDNTNNQGQLQRLQRAYGKQFANNDAFKYACDFEGKFTYIHFDMCCQSSFDIVEQIIDACQKLAPVSRLRYTGSRTLRGRHSRSRRQGLIKANYKALSAYCRSRADESHVPEKWLELAEATLHANDEAGGMIASIFCLWSTHMVDIFKRFYLGKDQYGQMYTFWIDFNSNLDREEEQELQLIENIIADSKAWRAG